MNKISFREFVQEMQYIELELLMMAVDSDYPLPQDIMRRHQRAVVCFEPENELEESYVESIMDTFMALLEYISYNDSNEFLSKLATHFGADSESGLTGAN